MRSKILDKISFWALFIVIVLLPVFFLPFTKIPLEVSKGLLLVVGLVVSIIFWIAARFSDGKIVLPKSLVLVSSLVVVVVLFFSALFSEARGESFFGIILNMGTFWFMFCAFLLLFASSIVLKNPDQAKIVLRGILISSSAVLIFQVLRLFFSDTLSLGFLVGKTGNILGSWVSFGFWAGFSTILSLLVVEFSVVSKKVKLALISLIALSIILIILVNVSLIWGILGIFALFIFIYKIYLFSGNQQTEDKKILFPVFSFSVFIISLLFFISGQFIGGLLPDYLKIPNTEIRPSFVSTFEVSKSVIKKDPIFGMGPNRFADAWAMHKPSSANSSPFWNESFDNGSGLLPTFVATTGLLGLFSLLLFFFFLILSGLHSILLSLKRGTNLDGMAYFIASLFLFTTALFFPVGMVLFLTAMAFAGIFVGLSSNHPNGEISISFLNNSRKSFIPIILLVVVMTSSAAFTFKYIERFIAASYFTEARASTTIEEAENAINKSVSIYSNDLYWRTYSQVHLLKINSLANKSESFSDEDRVELQTSLNKAVSGALSAKSYNPNSYFNSQTLGFVYETLGSLSIPNTYEKAIESYEVASTLNPLNPGIKLSTARIYQALGKNKEAKDYAEQAISLKQDYIDVYIFLSQVATSENNRTEAISYGEKALSFTPLDQNLIQYVNSLKNNNSINTTSGNSTTENKKQ